MQCLKLFSRVYFDFLETFTFTIWCTIYFVTQYRVVLHMKFRKDYSYSAAVINRKRLQYISKAYQPKRCLIGCINIESKCINKEYFDNPLLAPKRKMSENINGHLISLLKKI